MNRQFKVIALLLPIACAASAALAGSPDPNVSKTGQVNYTFKRLPILYDEENGIYQLEQCHISGQIDPGTQKCTLASVCKVTYDCDSFTKNSQGVCPDDNRYFVARLQAKSMTINQSTSCSANVCSTQPSGPTKVDTFTRCKDGGDANVVQAINKIMQFNSSTTSTEPTSSIQSNAELTDQTKMDAYAKEQAAHQAAELAQKCAEPGSRTLPECGGVGSAQ